VRFAFKTANQSTTWPDVFEVWRAADQIEVFESGWNFDHFYPIDGNAGGPCLEGWMMLAALAQATSRLRMGTMVTGIHYRHPAVLANMIATLDIISFQGRYYQLTDALNEPKGPQRPHPPICIGGGGEKRTLRTVARFAQHWNSVGGTPQEFARKRDVLYAHCADIGRDPSEITLSSHVKFDPAAGSSATAEEAAALGEAGLDLAIVYLRPPLTPAVLEPLAAALAQID